MQRIIIVIPCYNEAARLPTDSLLSAVHSYPWLSFVLVDDGSEDETFALCESLRAREPNRFQVIRLPRNQGKAEAVRQGMLAAFDAEPAAAGYFDADLATPLSQIEHMAALLERHQVHLVMGSRVKLLGYRIERSPMRHYLGRVFASLASLILKLDVYDTQCGAKLFRTTPAIRSLFEQPFVVNWSFDVELLARMLVLCERGELPVPELSIAEYPLPEWRDVSGSKLSRRAALKSGGELARIWLRYGRRH